MTPRASRWVWPIVLAAAALWSWNGLRFSPSVLADAAGSLHLFLTDFWPPDLSIWPQAVAGLVETIQIAILGTLIGFALSLPLGLLASTTLFPYPVSLPARFFATAVRIPPSLLWALLFVIVLGLGAVAGVAAIALYTAGFLAKLQYEAFEGLQRDSLDALRAMGASRFQVAWHAAMPEAANALRSQALFMFEYNVRASTVIGIVGAGGIGQLLRIQFDFFLYDQLLATLLFIFATVLAIDAASLLIRRRFIETAEGHRPRWREVITGIQPAPTKHSPTKPSPTKHSPTPPSPTAPTHRSPSTATTAPDARP